MQKQLRWTHDAFIRVLRPLVRLGLRMGLKYKQMDQALRTVLLEEAQTLLQSSANAKSNASQLSIATGIQRKEVTARLASPSDAPSEPALPLSAQTWTAWMLLATDDPALSRLPITSSGGETCFEALAAQASRGNVHHRTVLDDLLRLGMATEDNGFVALQSAQFVPAQDLQYMLGYLADHTADHLQAAVHNVLGEAPRMLEQAVYADGISAQECERIHQLARQRWKALHKELVKELTLAVGRSPQGTHRIKVGVYTLFEDTPAAPAPQGKTE
jgi:hypothetical protein